MLEKRWLLKPTPATEQEIAQADALREGLGTSPFLTQLLWQRGVTAFAQARDFFRPSLTHLHDPFLMKDMDIAVERLTDALEINEKILVYGDYDVDGTTSVTLVYAFLKSLGANVEFYIPDRYTEGYGIQMKGIHYAAKNNFGLIIALDCGVKSVAYIAEAKALGIDFIVCDHHRPGDTLPPAVAVLDPKRNDCNYPFDELTGCGVGFKLLQALCQTNNIPEEKLFQHLDLLVASIAADIVPMVGENRVLAYFGLQQLNTAPRAGFRALMKVAGISGEMDISRVVFGLAPRINAAGRIRHAHDAVNLMLAEDETEAQPFADLINDHNTDRRDLDSQMTQEALEMIENDSNLKNAPATVLFKNTWHKGVVGIVASRCIEHHYRPTIILTEANGKAAGSARSVHGFDLYDAIEACADLLEQFGGHTYAAGMTLSLENIPAFRTKFEAEVARRILPEQKTPVIEVDVELPLSAIDDKFWRIICQMAPFGPQNMTPVFVSRGVSLSGTPRILKEKHLKMDIRQSGSPVLPCIGFGMAQHHEALLSGQPFDVCYQVELNDFQGRKNLQLFLKDIKIG